MAAGKHILIRIFASLDDTDDVVVLDRAAVKMVTDVKLELEDVLPLDFLLDYVELGLIQADITNRRKILHGDIVAVCPVVHYPERNFSRADETGYSSLDHLLVERSHRFFIRQHLLWSLIPMSVVIHADLHVLAVDLLILLNDLGPRIISLVRPVYGHSIGLGVEENPGTFQSTFHLLELPSGMRLNKNYSRLFSFGRSCV